MDQTWKTVQAIIVSVGGAGVIISGFVALCAKIITNRLEQKYAQILSKELEKYKSNLSKKEYVSKTRFDAEFEIHRSLSKAYFDLVVAINTIIPDGKASVPADLEDRKKFEDESHSRAHSAMVVAQNVLHQNAPFILKEYYLDYTELLILSRKQLDAFGQRYNVGYLASPEEKRKLSSEDYDRTRELINKLITSLILSPQATTTR